MKPCGTEAHYQFHRRHGEPVDEACKTAHAAYSRERKQSKALASGRVSGVGRGVRAMDVSDAIDEIAGVLHGYY